MEGFFGLMIIMAIVSVVMILAANSESNAANERLSSAKSELSSIGWKMGAFERELREALRADPEDTGSQTERVKELLQKMMECEKEMNRQARVVNSCAYDAHSALEKHRFRQNFFGGGANDLAALLYYRNEKNLVDASYRGSTHKVDMLLIQRAGEYLRRHQNQSVLLTAEDQARKEKALQEQKARQEQEEQERKARAAKREQERKARQEKREQERRAREEKERQEKEERAKRRKRRVAAAAVLLMVIGGGAYVRRDAIAELNLFTGDKYAMASDEKNETEKNAEKSGGKKNTGKGRASSAVMYTSVGEGVNVRAASSTEGEKVGRLSCGDTLAGTGNTSEDGKWIEVYLSGTSGSTGWVYGEYLTRSEGGNEETAGVKSSAASQNTPAGSPQNAAVYARFSDVIDREIRDYVQDSFNAKTMSTGQTDKPTSARGWGNVTCYSSDESIVTVSDTGTVTAVGPGEAYVAVISDISIEVDQAMGSGIMMDLIRYTVR